MYVHYYYKLIENFVGEDMVDDRPRPIEIIIPEDDHKFKLNIEALEDILCDEDVRDKPVVVLSVAGAFRKGKSFLLDFFLRYLANKVSTNGICSQ